MDQGVGYSEKCVVFNQGDWWMGHDTKVMASEYDICSLLNGTTLDRWGLPWL